MIKLTRLDQRTVAINPDHIAWVEATPDTTLCLLGNRKIIVRESLDEVCERFIVARAKIGCTSSIALPLPANPMSSRRPGSVSGRPPTQYARPSVPPSGPGYRILDDEPAPDSLGYRGSQPSRRPTGGA